ncbi:hypothetical protein HBI56_178990 [Parastagonospora nodorum]|nr:hypothetical protein HBI10_053060 [Parastagonospora nodorum]KAH4016982.1 hypothetical protein HBI13_145880 [Parastagonospora nodorum]KAH4038338.1 hypothetical protein HBI09_050080 [Parastagonospora nodorum]KAH4087100.1 hypothetical protein HBH46_203080 [Parastagonospora nodorum]KAH4207749.1 hypothetical protein HBI95_108040 [Parastagonospora nodorum]
MEVLSVAASGMAVASLSLQLLHTIGTIKSFIRDVKGASKELGRLAALLDQLFALLDNVRDVMERQTSLQGQHFPVPASMIFEALKSCEKSLEPLFAIVEKHKKSLVGSVPAVVKWKDYIKFGFKTKDIAEFEGRIQSEIDYLHAALTVNSTSILTMVLPAMLQNQQKCMTSPLADRQAVSIQYQSVGKQLSSPRIRTRSLKRQFQQSWWSAQIGVYHRRSVTYFQNEENKARKPHHEQNFVSKSQEVILAWKLLKFGIRWTRHQYSYIPSSINVFPIVDCDVQFYGLLDRATIVEIQQTFTSGRLHPFTRNSLGFSLLHMAAGYYRADVIQLLMQYGLKPDLTLDGDSPFQEAMKSFPHPLKGSGIDTMRLLLHDGGILDNFEDETYTLVNDNLSLIMDLETLEWLWMNAGKALSAPELQGLRFRLLEILISKYNSKRNTIDEVTECIIRLAPKGLIQRYQEEGKGLIGTLFKYCKSSIESSQAGEAFIDLLNRLGLDVESCINMEGECFLEPRLSWHDMQRRVIFERSECGDWILRWVWVYDTSAPGYLLVSEYISLGVDACYAYGWPFGKPGYHKKSDQEQRLIDLRFNQRMMSKFRKERARMGQKRAKSRMPGSWNW